MLELLHSKRRITTAVLHAHTTYNIVKMLFATTEKGARYMPQSHHRVAAVGMTAQVSRAHGLFSLYVPVEDSSFPCSIYPSCSACALLEIQLSVLPQVIIAVALVVHTPNPSLPCEIPPRPKADRSRVARRRVPPTCPSRQASKMHSSSTPGLRIG